MPGSKSMFNNIVKHYVASFIKLETNIPESEKICIEQAVRSEILEDASKIISRDLAKKEANKEKKKILKKFTITLIIETLFIAFLVGIIVNQATIFIPVNHIAGITAIVISLLLCIIILLLNFLNIEKD